MREPSGRRLPRPVPHPASAADAWAAVVAAMPDLRRQPEALDPYTASMRQLHAMSLLSAEVNNGGFSQFFFNGGGLWLDDAIAGFAAAGLESYRSLAVEAADTVIARMDSLVGAQRAGGMDAYSAWAESAGLERFDDRWWELPDLDSALDRFVDEHAADLWEDAS